VLECKVKFDEFKFSAKQQPVVIACEAGQEVVIDYSNCPDWEPEEVEHCSICFREFAEMERENAEGREPRHHSKQDAQGIHVSGCKFILCTQCLNQHVNIDNKRYCPKCHNSPDFVPGLGHPGKPLRPSSVRNMAELLVGEFGEGLLISDDFLLHTASAGNNNISSGRKALELNSIHHIP
jgi:hypothetical protein